MGPTNRKISIHDGDISHAAYRLVVLAATLAFTAILLMWTLTTPPFRGMHEHENFNSIVHLEYAGGWPAPEDGRISQGVFDAMQQSGLYTALPRTTANWATTDFADVMPPADYAPINTANATAPAAVEVSDTSSLNPPLYFWLQAVAADAVGMEGAPWNVQLQFARFVNVLMAMWIPALIAAAAKHISTKRWAAATVAFIPLGIPGLASTVTTVSLDALLITCCLAVTATTTLVMHHGPNFRRASAVGLVLGVASVVSIFSLFMVPLVIAGFVLARPVSKWLSDVAYTVYALSVAVAVGGVWWILGQSFSNVALGGERHSAFAPPDNVMALREADGFLDFAVQQTTHAATTFWGSFGYFEVNLHPTFATLLTMLLFAAMAVGIVYARTYRVDSIILVGFVIGTFAIFLVTLWVRAQQGVQDFGLEGRFLYIVLGAGGAVIALGIAKMYAVGHVENGFPTWLPSGALGVGLFGLLTAFQGFYRPFDESLGQAITRWEMWTPGGLAVLIPAIVFLVLVIAVPIVVNVKILRPENWEVPTVASGVDQREWNPSGTAERVAAVVG